MDSNHCAMPFRPAPPNMPKSFCEPWDIRVRPVTIRKMARPAPALVDRMVLISGFMVRPQVWDKMGTL